MRLLLFFLIGLLASCASDDQCLSWQEAELRADAAIRYGNMIKDHRQSAIAQAVKPGSPQKAQTKAQLARLDPALIEQRAAQKAAKYYPHCEYAKAYNTGKITRERYVQLCEEKAVELYRLEAMQKEQERLNDQVRVAGVMNAYNQHLNREAQRPAWTPPPMMPINGGSSGPTSGRIQGNTIYFDDGSTVRRDGENIYINR